LPALRTFGKGAGKLSTMPVCCISLVFLVTFSLQNNVIFMQSFLDPTLPLIPGHNDSSTFAIWTHAGKKKVCCFLISWYLLLVACIYSFLSLRDSSSDIIDINFELQISPSNFTSFTHVAQPDICQLPIDADIFATSESRKRLNNAVQRTTECAVDVLQNQVCCAFQILSICDDLL
jgi:hypothetical protein